MTKDNTPRDAIPTPRTDEARDRCRECGLEFVPADEMEKVERELRDLMDACAPPRTSPSADSLEAQLKASMCEIERLNRAISDVITERDERGEVCGELYQVLGTLAAEAGRFGDPDVIKALDNASDNAMTHKDVLPFRSRPTPTRLEELEKAVAKQSSYAVSCAEALRLAKAWMEHDSVDGDTLEKLLRRNDQWAERHGGTPFYNQQYVDACRAIVAALAKSPAKEKE